MNPLELARQKRKAMAEQGVKVVHLSFKEKLLQNPTSRSLAIAAKCWECAGDGADGHKMTKDTIRTCKSPCALRDFRPYKE